MTGRIAAVRSWDDKKPGAALTARAWHRRNRLPCGNDLTAAPLEVALLTLAQARAILADPMRDMRYLETRLGPPIQAYLRWKRQSKAMPKTLDSIERSLARLAINIPAGVGVAELDVEHLILVLDTIPEGSWKLHRSHWNGFLRWSIQFDHRSAKNPMELLPTLLRQNQRRVYKTFSEGEQAAIVNASRLMDDPARDRARAILLLDCGLRKGEARGLRVADINPADRVVTVRGKGEKEREIPIRGPFWLAWESALLEPIPRWARDWQLDDYVWFPMRVAGAYQSRERQVTASYPDRPMSERAFHEWWKRLIDHAGVTYRKPHMTRHTFATGVLDATKGDIYAVKELLGHESTKTTEIYLHSSRRRKEEAADAYARVRRTENN